MIIKCPKCGTQNRIPDTPEPSRRYLCGKCKAGLTVVSPTPKTEKQRSPTPQIAIAKDKEKPTALGKALRKISWVHPLLFAIFPILALYAVNIREVSSHDIVIPVIAALAFALLLLFVFLLLISLIVRWRKLQKVNGLFEISNVEKAAIITSIFLILFFSYGHVLRWIGGWDNLHGTYVKYGWWDGLFMIWFVLFIIAAYFIIKAQRNLYSAALIMNVVAIVLVIVASMNVVIREVKDSQHQNMMVGSAEVVESGSGKAENLPDIYYIILDRYGSARTYKENYGFDNSEFINNLAELGFYVANETVANYWGTELSLESSLNMNYLHKEATVEPITGNILDYRVWHFLKSKGYKFVHFGSWFEATRENPYADVNINYYSMPEFSWFLFQTTWAYPFCVNFDIVDSWGEIQYKRVIYEFGKLSEIPKMKEPTFVFAHMLIPHPPFVFDRDGNLITPEQQAGQSYMEQCIEQLIATNKMVTELIEQLLASSDVPPIIVIQGDEGEKREDLIISDPSWNITKANEKELREKMSILNAYYLPDAPNDALYPSISPVNSFRLIFNLYFNCDFELLPDRNYIGTWGNFIDVTDKVKYSY